MSSHQQQAEQLQLHRQHLHHTQQQLQQQQQQQHPQAQQQHYQQLQQHQNQLHPADVNRNSLQQSESGNSGGEMAGKMEAAVTSSQTTYAGL